MSAFERDRRSGSSGVAVAFLSELARWAAVDRSPDVPALRNALFAWLRAAQAAQPSMALVHQFAARALSIAETAVERGDAAADLRASLAASCEAEKGDLDAAEDGLARTAALLLERRGSWIATLSASGAVRRALIAAHRAGHEPHVLVSESRPGLEGRDMAAALAAEGIPVWLVVDAALPLLVAHAAQVWLGADAVTEKGVVNKIGSFALALAAREHSVPVYALAVRRKFLPAATPALRIIEMPPDEVWIEPAAGVKPRNVYFEQIPLAHLRGIVVEDGVIGASEVAIAALDRALPEALAAAQG